MVKLGMRTQVSRAGKQSYLDHIFVEANTVQTPKSDSTHFVTLSVISMLGLIVEPKDSLVAKTQRESWRVKFECKVVYGEVHVLMNHWVTVSLFGIELARKGTDMCGCCTFDLEFTIPVHKKRKGSIGQCVLLKVRVGAYSVERTVRVVSNAHSKQFIICAG